jgi:N-carbamoyl-L-amino-acid hydrolase
LDAIHRAARSIGGKRNVTISTAAINADPPAACDPGVVAALIQSCEEEGLSYLRMISRAYHDSLFMSRICPVAMLFIPCRNGVSHRPDEYVSEQDVANGIRVLAGTLARLAA